MSCAYAQYVLVSRTFSSTRFSYLSTILGTLLRSYQHTSVHTTPGARYSYLLSSRSHNQPTHTPDQHTILVVMGRTHSINYFHKATQLKEELQSNRINAKGIHGWGRVGNCGPAGHSRVGFKLQNPRFGKKNHKTKKKKKKKINSPLLARVVNVVIVIRDSLWAEPANQMLVQF